MRLIFICIITVLLLLTGCASTGYNKRIKQVETHIRYKRYDSAETQLKSLIYSFPEKPEPYFLYGLVNYSKGNYYDCLLNFDKAERYGFKEKERIYFQKGIALYHTGNLGESENLLSLSVEHNPSPAVQKQLGIIRYELGDYAGAIDPLQKASTQFPDDLRCNHYLGLAFFREGKNIESLKYLRKALELDTKNTEIIFHTANLLMLNGQDREAINLYSRIPPESMYGNQGIYNSAEAYIRLGEYNSSIQLLTYLSEKKPGDYNVRFNLSAALIKMANYARAAEILTDLYNADRYDARVAYNLALAYQGSGKSSLSVRFYEEAISLDPGNPHYRYAYGIQLSENGNKDVAARQMETVLKLDPDYIHARNWLDNYRRF